MAGSLAGPWEGPPAAAGGARGAGLPAEVGGHCCGGAAEVGAVVGVLLWRRCSSAHLTLRWALLWGRCCGGVHTPFSAAEVGAAVLQAIPGCGGGKQPPAGQSGVCALCRWPAARRPGRRRMHVREQGRLVRAAHTPPGQPPCCMLTRPASLSVLGQVPRLAPAETAAAGGGGHGRAQSSSPRPGAAAVPAAHQHRGCEARRGAG